MMDAVCVCNKSKIMNVSIKFITVQQLRHSDIRNTGVTRSFPLKSFILKFLANYS